MRSSARSAFCNKKSDREIAPETKKEAGASFILNTTIKSYGFNQVLSGFTINLALLYAIFNVRHVRAVYVVWFILWVTNAKSAFGDPGVRHKGSKSCILLS